MSRRIRNQIETLQAEVNNWKLMIRSKKEEANNWELRHRSLEEEVVALRALTGQKSREGPERSSAISGGGFASQGTVKSHDNESGPECFKCGQICKDNSNLKNHVLSHYYQVFYEVLPDSKPYPCPDCGNTSRDRITLVRHYAFTHKKLFKMTDVTPELIAGFGNRKTTVRKKNYSKEEKAEEENRRLPSKVPECPVSHYVSFYFHDLTNIYF